MGVRQQSKQEVVAALRDRHWAASRCEKGQALDTLVEATGYHRKYATWLLRQGAPTKRPRLTRAGRPFTYPPPVIAALQVAAEATGGYPLAGVCGKRLAPALGELIPALEQEGAVILTSEVRAALLHRSAPTIDRRLARARQEATPHGMGTTKPGSLLKQQIPIKTYTPWEEQRPRFCEIALVAHCVTRAAVLPALGDRLG